MERNSNASPHSVPRFGWRYSLTASGDRCYRLATKPITTLARRCAGCPGDAAKRSTGRLCLSGPGGQGEWDGRGGVSWEDHVVPAENSIVFFQALKRAKVPAELHIFARGRHGLGLAKGTAGTELWPDLCRAWLLNQGVLERP